jgi:hypothetical protein
MKFSLGYEVFHALWEPHLAFPPRRVSKLCEVELICCYSLHTTFVAYFPNFEINKMVPMRSLYYLCAYVSLMSENHNNNFC